MYYWYFYEIFPRARHVIPFTLARAYNRWTEDEDPRRNNMVPLKLRDKHSTPFIAFVATCRREWREPVSTAERETTTRYIQTAKEKETVEIYT